MAMRTVFTVNLAGVQQFKATLCWLDVAGHPSSAQALVNDLDLEISSNGTIYYPYSLDPKNPKAAATNTGPNSVDPIEQTVIDNPADGAWTVRVVKTNVPQVPQSYALCLSQPAEVALVPVLTATPDLGPAPLTVAFSAAASTGQPSLYSWDFGDGQTTQGAGLVTVNHTYTASGTYTVVLTLDNQRAAMHVIHVTKRIVQSVSGKARAALRFRDSAPNGDDDLQFTLTTTDPEMKMSAADFHTAVHNNTFTSPPYVFAINIGGTPDNTVPTVQVAGVNLTKNASATTRDKTVKPNPVTSFKLNPVSGLVTVQLHHFALSDAFSGDGMSFKGGGTGTFKMPVEVESTDTIFRCVFTFTYKVSGNAKNASAKSP